MQQMLRSNKLNGVIKKLQNRGINQKLLLLLSVTTINELSFLDEEEKKELPKAVGKYQSEKAFFDLNSDIRRSLEERSLEERSLEKKVP